MFHSIKGSLTLEECKHSKRMYFH